MSMLSGVRNVAATLVRNAPLQARTVTNTPIAVPIPARTKVPKPQMAIMAAFMMAGIWFTPLWVATHVTTYNGTRKN